MSIPRVDGSLGPAIARGTRSVVHEWGVDGVAKVPLPGVPNGWILAEANIARSVHALGLPVPALLGMTKVDGRDVSVFERVDGPSMWDAVMNARLDPDEAGTMLATLHESVMARRAPISLPRQQDRVTCKLRSPRVTETLVGTLLALPASHGAQRLCHGDFHPKNIILSASGPMIVDWFDASRGVPICDIARTLVLLSGSPHHLPGSSDVTTATLARLRSTYLEALRASFSASEDLDAWVRVNAAARLAEGVDAAPLRRLLGSAS